MLGGAFALSTTPLTRALSATAEVVPDVGCLAAECRGVADRDVRLVAEHECGTRLRKVDSPNTEELHHSAGAECVELVGGLARASSARGGEGK